MGDVCFRQEFYYLLSPYVVRHFGGNRHRQFDDTAYGAVLAAPGCLVDHFADPFFLDGVGIRVAFFEDAGDDPLRALVVAGYHAFAAIVSVDGDGLLVLVNYHAFGVAYRYGAVRVVGPVEIHGIICFYGFFGCKKRGRGRILLRDLDQLFAVGGHDSRFGDVAQVVFLLVHDG